jgi:hypothetical protein
MVQEVLRTLVSSQSGGCRDSPPGCRWGKTHPGAMLGAGATLEHGLEDGLAHPRLARTLPSGDESAMNRASEVTAISGFASYFPAETHPPR